MDRAPIPAEDAARLRSALRSRFAMEPIAAFRDWYRVQSELAQAGETALCAALADDLWELLAARPADEIEGRLWNNAGAFYGTPGSAASLERAQECFHRALAVWENDEEKRARALHNLGSALAALGSSAGDLEHAVAAFEEALGYRDARREIARAVTLHHLGVAARKLAERSPESSTEHLERSAAALAEALELRQKHGLARGTASTRFQLGVSLLSLGRTSEARAVLAVAAEELRGAGRPEEADLARRLSAGE
jgi:tetratricopeptide (TPR) repeat protein